MYLGYNNNAERILSAIGRSQAIIEFDLTGKILTANQNFCAALGYSLSEIKGQHHRMFVDPTEAQSAAYADFWRSLASGRFDQRQYKRIGKGGREIWIEASYNPVFKGKKPYKVIKFATDITAQKLLSAEESGKLNALSRAQAVIEFTPTGEIITANANFLTTLGYQLSDIQGQHHSIFCEPTYARSGEYRQFWERLRAGEFVAEEFTRYTKGGKKVYIQASYNPIFDMSGNVFKVVKFATDVTGRVENVESLALGMKRLADGDLTATIDTPFIPALDRLRGDFNETVVKLQDAMRSVGDNARGIAAGSGQIRSAADDLSRRTEQQAASLEETAAALEEITTAVADSSKRAEEAGRLVAITRDGAEKSGVVVRDAIGAMGDIASSSKEVSNIISVIDGIAFQTNLLALNAGVEAARAGDAGKGFAVVAQEVRELAQRSAQAAKEIKGLITTSSQQVDSGVNLVAQAGQALEQIVTQVQEINRNVCAIVEAGREQSVGLKEINLAVNTLDQGTQKNAAMVEETTAASHSLAREAEALFALIGQFRVEGRSGTRQPVIARKEPRLSPSLVRPRASGRSTAASTQSRESWEEF